MQFVCYQDEYFNYFWKPHSLATTFGNQKSFLDYFNDYVSGKYLSIINRQKKIFSKEEEFGLLNRLDNDTAGLLYFAKTHLIKEKYHQLQLQDKIQKTYIADVNGNLFNNYKSKFVIDNIIFHHRFQKDRMVVLINNEGLTQCKLIEKYKHKIRGKAHYIKTIVIPLRYDKRLNITTCSVVISKGIRHQIRAHLSSIGYPIVGDKIYNKKSLSINLHLWSIGLKILKN